MSDVKTHDGTGDRIMDVTARIRFVVVEAAGAAAVDPTNLDLKVRKAKLIDGDSRSVIADGSAILGVDVICSAEEGQDDMLEKALKSLSACAWALRQASDKGGEDAREYERLSGEAIEALFDLGRRDLWDEEPGDDEEDHHAPVLGGEGG